jgi:hypothetical protein
VGNATQELQRVAFLQQQQQQVLCQRHCYGAPVAL